MDLNLLPYIKAWDTTAPALPPLSVAASTSLAPVNAAPITPPKMEAASKAFAPPERPQPTGSAPGNLWKWVLPMAAAATLTGSAVVSPETVGPVLAGLGGLSWAATSLATGAHILASNNGRQSPFGWLVAAAIPFIGPALWFALGAEPHLPTSGDPKHTFFKDRFLHRRPDTAPPDAIPDFVPPHFQPMLKVSRSIAREPLTKGNHVTALHNGEEVYPSMLATIDNEPAGGFVYVGVYIFENNKMGETFAAALRRAQERGVEVRVIVDGWGSYLAMPHDLKKISRLWRERGRLPTSMELLDRHGVNYRRFAPKASLTNGLPWNIIYHKKFLITSQGAYLGGINLGDSYMITDPEAIEPHQDLQFHIQGPAARRIEAFHRRDWTYLTGESDSAARADQTPAGHDFIRVVPSLPNDDFENFKRVVIAALSHAGDGEKVRIRTAYFAPDRELIRAMEIASRRGATVQLVLSEKNTVPPVDWAARQFFKDMLDVGVEIYYQPPPFDHTKILIVGDYYVLGGSANLDHRSLTFHNEITAEIYSQRIAAQENDRFDAILAHPQSCRITPEWVASWPWHERLRNGFSQVFAYLG